METLEFVSAIRERVINSAHTGYENLLDSSVDAEDPLWKEILPFYKSLTLDQRELFLNFIRLIQVNTVSHFLGILDGSTYLTENRVSFILETELERKLINGNLQDIFLELEGFGCMGS